MICPKCGNEIDDSNIFCPKCGTKLKDVEEKAAEPKEKKKIKINTKAIIVAIIVLCLVGVGFGLYKYNSLPSTQYKKAENAFASGNYEKAIKYYTAAGSYEDSLEKIPQAEIRLHYEQAKKSIEQKDFDVALDELTKTNGFEDTDQLVKQCHYEKGVLLMSDSEFKEAAEEFVLSKGYEDSDSKIIEMGEGLVQSGDYAQAVEIFSKTSSSKTNKYCNYANASINYNEKKYDEAAKLYKASDKILDSEEKYKECEYEAGKVDISKKQYSSARMRYVQLGTYMDSKDLVTACDLYSARDSFNEGKLNTAKETLEKLPKDYSHDGISVSDLLDKINSSDKWAAICGKWTSTGGQMRSTQDGSYYDYWWYYDFKQGDVNIEIKCIPQSDGSAKVTVTGKIPVYTSYSSIGSLVDQENKSINVTKLMSNYGTMAVDDYTSVTIKENSISINYKKTDRSKDVYFKYIYKTDVTFGKRTTAY